jgi:ribosomal-protein-alanine N-acetyltransferase
MISFTNDLSIVNSFLKNFNIKIDEQDCFQKFLIYKKNNEIIGFVDFSYIYDRIEINYIFVKEDYRKQNIATELFNYILEFCKENKCENITLEVNENNIPAVKFYLKNGFKKTAVRKNYYGNENGILMIREMM